MMRTCVALVLLLGACTADAPTAIELHASLPMDRGITQLMITGALAGQDAFAPGLLPEEPRPLEAHETTVILLPDSFDGEELVLYIDGMNDSSFVDSGSGTITVARGTTRTVEITVGGDVLPDFDDDDGDGSDDPADDTPVDAAHPNAMLTFEFRAADNAKLTADVSATILGSRITASLPKGADPKKLVATFATSGEQVTVEDVPQTSGQTLNDYSSGLSLVVHANNGAVRTYTARAVVSNDSPAILAFGFAAGDNAALTIDSVGVAMMQNIVVVVPEGTDRTQLVPTFCATGAVTVDGISVTTGVTPVDFSIPRTVSVTTSKGTKTFGVSVTSN